MSKVKANTFRHTAASSDAITLHNDGTCTINGNVTLSGTVTGDNDTIYDDTNLRRDLNTLALQTAVDTNRKAYNLQNSFIEQFEDDTGILTETTVDRNASEYVSTAILTTTYVSPALREVAHGNANIEPATSTWTGGGATNDRYYMKWNNTGTWWYAAVGVDYLWDLTKDFTMRIFFNDDSGDISNRPDNYFNCCMTPDTSKTSGNQPSGVWKDPAMQANTIDGSPSWDNWINNTYAAAGVSNLVSLDTEDEHDWVETNTLSDPWNRTINANSGVFAFGGYWLNSTAGSCAGWQVDYVESTATMKVQLMASGSRTTLKTDNVHTVTNCPKGRALFILGSAHTMTGTDVWSSTYNGGSSSDYSSVKSLTTNATGTLISNAQTVSTDRTKVSGTILYKDASGTAALGTDLKVSFSCDNGSNWETLDATAGNYTAGSDFSTGIKTAYLKEVTCSPAGKQIKYKVEWANQSAGSKVTELHGIAINY